MNLLSNLGTHAAFIVAAYAVAVLVVIALISWVWIDHRAQKRQLARLQAHSMARRSEKSV